MMHPPALLEVSAELHEAMVGFEMNDASVTAEIGGPMPHIT
jgi:hypothetical protein